MNQLATKHLIVVVHILAAILRVVASLSIWWIRLYSRIIPSHFPLMGVFMNTIILVSLLLMASLPVVAETISFDQDPVGSLPAGWVGGVPGGERPNGQSKRTALCRAHPMCSNSRAAERFRGASRETCP